MTKEKLKKLPRKRLERLVNNKSIDFKPNLCGRVVAMDIKLVKQTKKHSCTHACMAMLKGLSEDDVLEKFPGDHGSIIQLRLMLAYYQVPVMDVNPVLWPSMLGGLFLLSADIGGECRHAFIVRVNKDNTYTIHDPLLGEETTDKVPYMNISEALYVFEDKLPD